MFERWTFERDKYFVKRVVQSFPKVLIDTYINNVINIKLTRSTAVS